MIAKAIASAVGGQFFKVTCSDVLSKYQGDSEKAIRALFVQAKECAQAVLFIDEVDSLATSRSSDEPQHVRAIKTEMLTSIDELRTNAGAVLVMATNCPWDLDDAVRRRAEKRFYIPLPELDDRAALLAHELKKHASLHALSDADVRWVAAQTEMYSGADLTEVLSTAKDLAREDMMTATHFVPGDDGMFAASAPDNPAAVEMTFADVPDGKLADNELTLDHFRRALEKQKPNLVREDLRRFEQWTERFGQSGR